MALYKQIYSIENVVEWNTITSTDSQIYSIKAEQFCSFIAHNVK